MCKSNKFSQKNQLILNLLTNYTKEINNTI